MRPHDVSGEQLGDRRGAVLPAGERPADDLAVGFGVERRSHAAAVLRAGVCLSSNRLPNGSAKNARRLWIASSSNDSPTIVTRRRRSCRDESQEPAM
jgi:hypothetical protein